MGKKNKKEMAKRRAQPKQMKRGKRKLRPVESRRKPDVQVMYRPGIADMEAPAGFRAINMSQAIL